VTPMFPTTRGSAHRPGTAGTGWPACTQGNFSVSPKEASTAGRPASDRRAENQVPGRTARGIIGGWVMRSFHDGTGGLTRARAALNWYPDDVWRYVLSCQWSRIAEEEAFPGRCAEAGDELGSVGVTARLTRDLMRLWLLMQRRYPPYSKWLGS